MALVPTSVVLMSILLTGCSSVHGRILRPSGPPRGWNSWDSFGPANATQARQNAEFLAQNLQHVNFNYVVVDEGWFNQDGQVQVDDYGRLVPTEQYFPGSNGSFKAFADEIHGMGLKFGFWIMFGIPQVAVEKNTPIKGTNYRAKDISLGISTACPWSKSLMFSVNGSHPAAKAYYQSVVEMYDEWGIDFLKMDCSFAVDMTAQHQSDVFQLKAALEASSRSYVLSLSPGGECNATALQVMSPEVTMARVTQDFWDSWSSKSEFPSSMATHFEVVRDFANFSGSGFFIDLDMLPLGRIGHPGSPCSPSGPGCPRQSRFTPDEQKSIMSLWIITRSPLMFGGNLPETHEDTISLVSNAEAIGLQDVINPCQLTYNQSDIYVYSARRKQSTDMTVLAIFNVGDKTQQVSLTPEEIGLPVGTYDLRDVWAHKDVPSQSKFSVELPSHGSALWTARQL